jgi:hypothetical protein
VSVEEVFLDALVNGTNHFQSGETPDSPQCLLAVEAIRVKSTTIVTDFFNNVNLLAPFGIKI